MAGPGDSHVSTSLWLLSPVHAGLEGSTGSSRNWVPVTHVGNTSVFLDLTFTYPVLGVVSIWGVNQ